MHWFASPFLFGLLFSSGLVFSSLSVRHRTSSMEASPAANPAVADDPHVDPSPVEAAQWIYRMQVASALPLVNLDRTPISALLSPENHDRFLKLMRRAYARYSSLYRLSGVLLLSVLMLPREIGYWLTVPTFLLAIPSLSCSLMMQSSDILWILVGQYEFWFFTVMNTINWGCLASFYSDFRIVSLIGGVVGMEAVILIDANFRTTTSSFRSMSVAAPVLLTLGLASFFRVIDTDPRNYRVIPVAKVNVNLIDVFTNTAVTLAIFIARKGYSKRKVLITKSAKLQTIRCVVFRSKLQLKKSTPQFIHSVNTGIQEPLPPSHTLPSSTFLSRSLRQLPMVQTLVESFKPGDDGLTAAPPPPAEATTPPMVPTGNQPAPSTPDAPLPANESKQQVTLVTMRLSAVDVRQTLWRRLSPVEQPLSTMKSVLFHACGVIGAITTAITLTRKPALVGSPASSRELAIAVISLVSTLVFFTVCAASFQRALAKSLLHNFDFLFSSVQFTLSMLLVSDMMQWDFRAMGAVAWFLWFHLVLFLDALTPPIKHNLRLRKIYLLPVVVATLAGIILIIYGFFFADAAKYFRERTLWETTFRGKKISMQTKSLLLNRLFTVLLWSCRLIWEVSMCPDDELTFIRGGLDYYTPMEMFPPLHHTPSHAAITPGSDGTTTKSTSSRWPKIFTRSKIVAAAEPHATPDPAGLRYSVASAAGVPTDHE